MVTIKSDANGEVDVELLKKTIDKDTAAFMVTNPNTLGLFERKILEVQKVVHEAGALLYYDGANLNPLLGVADCPALARLARGHKPRPIPRI